MRKKKIRKWTSLPDFTFFTYLDLDIFIIEIRQFKNNTYQKIKLGASLVQLYSAFAFQGPNLINRMNKELVQLIKKDGFNSISEAIGSGI